jgi:hypothetical protein
VRNTLKAANLKAVTKKKKPLLSPTHRKKRLAFTLKHQHWTVGDWKRVRWSGICMEKGRRSTRRKRSKRYSQGWRRKLDGMGLYGMEWSRDIV